MGGFASRQNTRNDDADSLSNQVYRYPSKSGNYFGDHFFMGGEKFDVSSPEVYLFGDNMDLNFLGNKPIPIPYPVLQKGEAVLPLRCLVNIRRESLRFVRVSDQPKDTSYNIEFTFDTDVRCSITIFYFCIEEVTSNGVKYISRDDNLTSDVYYYKRGINQLFSQSVHVFNPSLYSDQDLFYNCEKDVIPIAIHCVALEGLDEGRQSHTTYGVIERHSEDSYSLKALKQKIFCDGLCYLLQEIYGIENKLNDVVKESIDDDFDECGLECVICISEMRDTLILPCRHLCLCRACAESLRYQASNCPICRSPFRALLQVKGIRKTSEALASLSEFNEGVPIGYERVSLIEALNGPAFAKKVPILEPSTLEPLLDSSSTSSTTHSSVTTVIVRNK